MGIVAGRRGGHPVRPQAGAAGVHRDHGRRRSDHVERQRLRGSRRPGDRHRRLLRRPLDRRGWTGRAAPAGKAQASSLYNLFYYGGSSVIGWFGGVAYDGHGWTAVAGTIVTLAVIAAAAAAVFLPENLESGPTAQGLGQRRRDLTQTPPRRCSRRAEPVQQGLRRCARPRRARELRPAPPAFADKHESRRALQVRQPPLAEWDFRRPGADERVLAAPTWVSQFGSGEAARHSVANTWHAKQPGREQIS